MNLPSKGIEGKDFTHVASEFREVRSAGPNGPHELETFRMVPGPDCDQMEKAFQNLAPSAGGFHRIWECKHCQFFTDSAGDSILSHLAQNHSI